MDRPTVPTPRSLLVPFLLPLVSCSLIPDAPAQSGSGLVNRSSPLRVVESNDTDRDLRTTPVVRAVQRSADSVVSIYLKQRSGPQGQGSGVILDESGLVITNWHVVAPVVLGGADALHLQVKLRDGRNRDALVLSSTPTRDLALLQMQLEPGEKVKPMEIGRSSDLMIGETVIAIGNPQGHANTVTSGVLSAIDREITVLAPDRTPRKYTGLLQTDAAINQGNSGGALLDITGRLIGINNAMAMGAENIGFAIPIDTVREQFERELVRSGSFAGAADSAWLGLEVAEREGAVVVDQVVAGGPAAAAGVQVGDVLARIGDAEVRTTIDYLRHVYDARADQPLPLTLRRAAREVRVAPVPISRNQRVLQAAIGAVAEQIDVDVDRALVRKVTLAFHEGTRARGRVPLFPAVVRIKQLQPDGPAAAIGLQAGDVLLSVTVRQRMMFGGFQEEDVPVVSLHDFTELVQQFRGRSLRLTVLRGDDALVGTLDVRQARS
jgi:S1-C subfamily serine protease